MGDGDWDALAPELVRQNYAFVAIFSVLLWDFLITLRQEVKYVWYCQSRVTKYHFLCCRYCAMVYFIICSIFGTQWTLQIPTSSRNCKTWFLIHVASLGILYVGSQVILIRKVFYLYGRSALLATGLFAINCSQVAAALVLSDHISSSLNFNPICNGRKVPKTTSFALATAVFTQFITWALILPKVWAIRPRFFPVWLRHLRTSEAHTKLSWGLCLVAILLSGSLSFTTKNMSTVYVFTFPITMFSIGTCRYILRVEKDRITRAKLADAIDTAEDRQERIVLGAEQSHGGALPIQNRHRHSYPPQPPTKMPCPRSESDELSMRTSVFQAREHNVDAVAPNSSFPYLHGAQSFELNRNRRSIATTFTHNSSPSSSDCGSRHTADFWTTGGSRAGSGPSPSVGTEATDAVNQDDVVEDTQSASNIEIGSLQSSSSVNSEELRQFYNDMWNVGSFITVS